MYAGNLVDCVKLLRHKPGPSIRDASGLLAVNLVSQLLSRATGPIEKMFRSHFLVRNAGLDKAAIGFRMP